MSQLEDDRHFGWVRSLLERQALAFHYDHARRTCGVGFPAETVHKVALVSKTEASCGLVFVGSVGYRHTALYFFEKTEDRGRIGYRFRKLTTEVDGKPLEKATLRARRQDVEALAQLGLSRREIATVSGQPLASVTLALKGF